MFEVKFNNIPTVFKLENKKPEKFGPVQVFGGDPWYPAADGKIRNLNIHTKNIGFQMAREWVLKKGDLITNLDYIGKEFKVEFDFWINKLVPGYSSIIHLTQGGNYARYGDRIPAVWAKQ